MCNLQFPSQPPPPLVLVEAAVDPRDIIFGHEARPAERLAAD